MVALYDSNAPLETICDRHVVINPGAVDAFHFSVEIDGAATMENVKATTVAGSFFSGHETQWWLLRRIEIGVFDRSGDGVLTLGVKTLEVKSQLYRARMTLLGEYVSFKAQILDTCYYMDLFGVTAAVAPRSYWSLTTASHLTER